jgi:hypothetical protein
VTFCTWFKEAAFGRLFFAVLVFCLRGAFDFFWCLRGHPLFRIGLLALPLCGAALTFFAAAKKVSKESGFTPPVPARITARRTFLEPSRSDVPTP